ncbi:MAG: aminotransferase class V-fold PLP-dependent enzyme [Pseudomonadota bacterium]
MENSEIERLRAETRGCENVIHFNNAGASLMPDPVYNAMLEHLELERCTGGYEAKTAANDSFNNFYTAFSQLLNCQPNEIAFIENATRAWDMAFHSIDFSPGDRILTARSEYVSNYLGFLRAQEQQGVEICPIPDDEHGQLDIAALETMIDERVKLIAVTHIPTQGGLVNPAIEIGRIARTHNILYLLDACQSVGQMPLDVEAIGCDILSGTGRKFLRGPRGTGFLYVKQSVLEKLTPPFIDLHSANWIDANSYRLRPDAQRFENWERFFAGQISLGCAVDYAIEIGLDRIWRRVEMLGSTLRTKLEAIPGVRCCDLGRTRCGIVTFLKEGESPDAIAQRMLRNGININVSNAASARIDMGDRNIEAMNRSSVHYYNTEAEIDRFVDVLASA